MRNPNRLSNIYTTVCLAHQEFLPDIRIGQLMSNFYYWLKRWDIDMFTIEDDMFEKYFKKYIEENTKRVSYEKFM